MITMQEYETNRRINMGCGALLGQDRVSDKSEVISNTVRIVSMMQSLDGLVTNEDKTMYGMSTDEQNSLKTVLQDYLDRVNWIYEQD